MARSAWISLARAEPRSGRRWAMAACVAALGAMAGASIWRAALWRDPVRLWLDTTAKAPDKSRCWNNLGMAQLTAGEDAEALAAFRRALDLDPANENAGRMRSPRRYCAGARARRATRRARGIRPGAEAGRSMRGLGRWAGGA